MRAAMLEGKRLFRHKGSGRVFVLDPAQVNVLEDDDDGSDVLLIGHPAKAHPRQKGRKWQWLAPRNLELAEKAV